MNRRPVRALGWAVLGIGGVLTVAGLVMLISPGPGWAALLLGLVVAVAGVVLVAVGSRPAPTPD
jgi:uncharacterized membrane protein HdeD (DUF308 family)